MRLFVPAFILFLFISFALQAQTYFPFEQIKKYTATQKPGRFDSSLNQLTNRLGSDIHYLYPLYQAIGWESKFKRTMGVRSFYLQYSQLLSFAGDYGKANEYAAKTYDSISSTVQEEIRKEVNSLSNIQYVAARNFIIGSANTYRVVMINEAHHKPMHRAFTYSLLEDLYKQGFRYFAMETFNNNAAKSLESLTLQTGYYTNEPVGAELARKALQLGYTLVAYEDAALQKHSLSQRDSIQANNLAAVIKKDPAAKILVHAGYGHIAEQKTSGFTPMAVYFKKLTGLDPLTIEQTDLSEGSNFEYGRVLYEVFTKKFTITEPSILLQNKKPLNLLEQQGYDLVVMHPRDVYDFNRPAWLNFYGSRFPLVVQPTEKTLFMVQAYYENEYTEAGVNQLVPADQTYTAADNGYYYLYLHKGKYKLVLRDAGYKILAVKDAEVK